VTSPAQAAARPARARPRSPVLLAILAALQALMACNAVAVRRGETTAADVKVPTQPVTNVNILAIGRADADGRIVLRGTGISVARGETVMIGLSGPGMIPGTGFVVLGFGFQTTVVRFGETQGGSGMVQPAVVLSLAVPPDTPPGLYSIVAMRGFEFALFSGSIEVL
jgi:hypothetical protein